MAGPAGAGPTQRPGAGSRAQGEPRYLESPQASESGRDGGSVSWPVLPDTLVTDHLTPRTHGEGPAG